MSTMRSSQALPRYPRRTAASVPTLSLAVALAFGGCASSQGGAAGPSINPNPDARLLETMPPGTRVKAQLEQTLSTDGSAPGDRWTAVVTEDVTDGRRVLLQRGAVISGEVTRSGEVEIDGETRTILAVRPTRLRAENRSYTIEAEVIEAERRESGGLLSRRNVAIVGGATLAGTLLGEILLDKAVLGAVLGAAGGTAIAVATADTEIEIREGSVLTLELEDEVRPVVAGGGSS